MTSVCLVHLGGRDFCFVETGQSQHLADIQHIGVTTFEIVDDGEEGNPVINTLHSTVYAVDTSDLETFDIDFGFATWLDDVEPEGEIMTLLIEQEEAECKANRETERLDNKKQRKPIEGSREALEQGRA
ncbi:hypothetical protein ACFX2J_037976 [Malus domestica]